jgi:hypothetical protein
VSADEVTIPGPYQATRPCKSCGGHDAWIETKNGQDMVSCLTCADRPWIYNAPKAETGRKARTLSSREGITPSQKARILAAHDHCCIACGHRPPEVQLDLEHIIAREVAYAYGCLDWLIDSEWNLAPMCAECNSGKRWVSEPQVRLMYRVLMMKAMPLVDGA